MPNVVIILFDFIMSLPAWEIGSAIAERAGQGEVGGCTWRVQTAWLCLHVLHSRKVLVGTGRAIPVINGVRK